jgi:hypothetical protein
MTRDRYDLTQLADRNRYAEAIFEGLSGWAYGAYLKHGRGAVILHGEKHNGPDGPETTRYMPLAAIETSDIPDEIKGYVREYDPSVEIVVIWHIRNFGLVGARYYDAELTPEFQYLLHTNAAMQREGKL